MKLIQKWCDDKTDCQKVFASAVYMPDNTCQCGISKHHYHCVNCGGVNQVG